MEEITNQNTNQQPTTQPADNGNKSGGKMFTQEEVNQIIKDRLARERAKAAPQEPTEAEKKETDFAARESRLNCRAYLLDSGYPAELLDVLDTSDIAKFKKAADTVSRLMKAQKPRYVGGLKSESGNYDIPKTGFEPNSKLKPKVVYYASQAVLLTNFGKYSRIYLQTQISMRAIRVKVRSI